MWDWLKLAEFWWGCLALLVGILLLLVIFNALALLLG